MKNFEKIEIRKFKVEGLIWDTFEEIFSKFCGRIEFFVKYDDLYKF